MGEAVILTSETAPAFYARKLDIAPTEPAAATKVEPAVESEPAKPVEAKSPEPGAESNDDDQPQKPESKVHVRFSELTEKANAAQAKAEAAEAKANAAAQARALAEAEAASLRAKYEPPKPDEIGPKPQRAQFVDDEQFAQALEEWTTDKVERATEAKHREAAITKTWHERQAAARAEIPDYDEAIAAAKDLGVSDAVRDAILESEQGPKILHHLSKNPSLAADLLGMKVDAQLRQIGKLEGKFEASAPSAPAAAKAEAKPVVVAAEISKAPAPIKPLSGGNSSPEPFDPDRKYTAAEWRDLRKAGKIK